MVTAIARAGDIDALRDLVQQSERSGARRRAVLLHTDRLPQSLGRPHHVRLARQALHSLAEADRAQLFDLPLGRVAIVWRGEGAAELAQARQALEHLLSGQPDGAPVSGELLTLYDLPAQAVWLLDQLDGPPETRVSPSLGVAPLDLKLLMRLEAGLAQADLSRFVRCQPVMAWPAAPLSDTSMGTVAWEERAFAMHELAAALCPERQLDGDPWLFRRLTRTLDRRMLAMLTAGRELRTGDPFALDLNVASILSPEFLRFDEALPVTLRGQVILNLTAPDILSDPATFIFARNFAHARQYRLALAEASPAILRFIDAPCAGLAYIKLALGPDIQTSPQGVRALLPAGIPVIVTGLNKPSAWRWARQHGFTLGQGRVFSQ